MKALITGFLINAIIFLFAAQANAQLVVNNAPNALALAQRLVGDGVTISNVTFTGNTLMTGFFNNNGGTNIGIDSGIVLTTGIAKTRPPNNGVDGNSSFNSDFPHFINGDNDLSALISAPTLDACVLEFQFVPLGDSIKFNYIFSSEEYPEFACDDFNDAFAFFISGPGITGLKNIALIPNTNLPVTIDNINNVLNCSPFPQYYVDNSNNAFFTHDGHTVVLTAKERVQPCEIYTLKLVIADVGDENYDSGVFLQAKSLTSNAIGMTNLTQIDPVTGISYLVEGCATGAFNIRRPRKDPTPLVVNLSYAGTATNGVDVLALPTSVVIPANDSVVTVNINPVMDLIPEGIETLKVYALAGCAAGTPTDSTLIQLRDYDILSLVPDTAYICKQSSVQLIASTGYTIYQWNTDPTLSSTSIRNPIATPVNSATTYVCTANVGTCNAQDSVFVKWKDIEFISKQDVACRNGTTGNIKVQAGSEWITPEFSLNGITWQPDSNFYNLPVGIYWVKVRDANCIDSIQINLIQSAPDLLINNTTALDASCSGNADGQITITAAGGTLPYSYSVDGINFQGNNLFNVLQGNYTILVKDMNGCLNSRTAPVALNNSVTVDAGNGTTICESKNFTMAAVSNATSFAWTPAATLSNPASLNPVASPTTTTKYFLTATTGICNRIDSVTINVWPAPIADAGPDASYCFGKTYQLAGAGGVNFNWSPATYITSSTTDQNPFARANRNIFYQLMVTDINGCQSLVADQVAIEVVPAVKIFAGNDTIAAINQPIQLNAIEKSNAGVTQYTWTTSNFLSNANIANPIATLPFDYRYIVTGTTPEGCEGQDDIFIKVYKGPEIYVPSGFTPNNDGLNDWIAPIPVGIKEFRYFRIFNRWGQLVYTTSNPYRGWNGKLNGVLQGNNTFVWMAEAVDFKGNVITRKGVVTLIR